MKRTSYIATGLAIASLSTLVALAWVLTLGAEAGAAANLGPIHALSGGPFEASGVVQAPGGSGVLFVDDGRADAVFWLSLAADGSPAAVPVAVPLGVRVVDPEGITTDGTYVYVVGSQSRGSRDGAGLVRFRYDAKARRAQDAQAITDLASLLSAKVSALGQGTGRRRSPLNVEGLAWDAKGGRLLLGLRAPLDGGQRAMVMPVRLRDPRGAFTAANLEVGSPLGIDLGGSGIRGMEADPSGGFWVLAGGVTNAGTSRLVRWDGRGPDVREIATFPRDLKPEGVTRTRVGGKDVTLVLCDTSRYVLLH